MLTIAVLRKTGLTQAALSSLIADGKFPEGIIEGRYRKRRWRAEVVQKWLSEQSEAQEETCSYLALIG